MTIEIPLTQGYMALIDDEDHDRVTPIKWRTLKHKAGPIYAQTTMRIGNRRVETLLHRFILNAPKGIQVDHRNMDGLDCRRSNLRLCTPSQNNANQGNRGKTSKYKGVSFAANKKQNCWVVHIGKDRLGSFETEIEAALAYDSAALERYGEFARLNFERSARQYAQALVSHE